MESNKKAPVFKAKVGGIEAAVWNNETKEGSYMTVTAERSYKDKDNKWQKTGSMRVNDLPKVVLALNKCYEFITMNSKED